MIQIHDTCNLTALLNSKTRFMKIYILYCKRTESAEELSEAEWIVNGHPVQHQSVFTFLASFQVQISHRQAILNSRSQIQ